MKVAVSSTGDKLEANVDPRFGRCPYFMIVDTDSMEFEAIQNPAAMAGGGAGIQAAQLVAGKGVEAVLTGNVGPNAYQTLAAAGVKIAIGATGTVQEAVEKYKNGELKGTSAPTVGGHFGMGQGMGGGGMGAGRGGGGGGGGRGRVW